MEDSTPNQNMCIKCGNPVGNETFSYCEDCFFEAPSHVKENYTEPSDPMLAAQSYYVELPGQEPFYHFSKEQMEKFIKMFGK